MSIKYFLFSQQKILNFSFEPKFFLNFLKPSFRSDMIARRPSATRLTIGGPMKNTVLGIINNHLSTSEKDKVKIQKVVKK